MGISLSLRAHGLMGGAGHGHHLAHGSLPPSSMICWDVPEPSGLACVGRGGREGRACASLASPSPGSGAKEDPSPRDLGIGGPGASMGPEPPCPTTPFSGL